MSFNLDNYVDVATRLKQLLADHPNATIEASVPRVIELATRTFIEVTVRITDGDKSAQASAWEPIPGSTPYTRDSEMMNAETSALGRACMMFGGYGLQAGKIASLDEVRNRRDLSRAEHPSQRPSGKPTEKMVKYLNSLIAKTGIDPQMPVEEMSFQECKDMIDVLKLSPEVTGGK